MEGWELFVNSLVPMLTGAIQATIPLAIITFVLGLIVALVTAMMRFSKSALLKTLATIYVSAIRGTPLLVQLFIIFYGLPVIGLTIDPLSKCNYCFYFKCRCLCFRNDTCLDFVHSKRAMGSSSNDWDDEWTAMRRIISPRLQECLFRHYQIVLLDSLKKLPLHH